MAGIYIADPFEFVELTRNDKSVVITTITPQYKDSLNQLFKMPTGLDYYNICFKDLNSAFYYEDNKRTTDFNWTINFDNNQEIFLVGPSKETCTKTAIKSDKKFSYYWSLSAKITIDLKNPKNGTFAPNTTAYARPELTSIILRLMLVLFAWWGLILIIIQIINLYRKQHWID